MAEQQLHQQQLQALHDDLQAVRVNELALILYVTAPYHGQSSKQLASANMPHITPHVHSLYDRQLQSIVSLRVSMP